MDLRKSTFGIGVLVAAFAIFFAFGSGFAMMGGHSGKGMMGAGGSGGGKMMGSGGMMEKGSGGMMSGKSKGHGGMMGGTMVYEGEAMGMKLTANVIDVVAKMREMGRTPPKGITHHIMITPSKRFSSGTEAKLVVTYPNGEKREVGLMAMGNHMGADLYLPEPGKYSFQCTIASGGEKSSFSFSYEVKE